MGKKPYLINCFAFNQKFSKKKKKENEMFFVRRWKTSLYADSLFVFRYPFALPNTLQSTRTAATGWRSRSLCYMDIYQ